MKLFHKILFFPVFFFNIIIIKAEEIHLGIQSF